MKILFRGKRCDTGKLIFGYYIKEHRGPGIGGQIIGMQRQKGDYIGFPGEEWKKVIPETVGQFTGSYDKNKKMIFNGDKIAYKDDSGTQQTGIIKYTSGHYYCEAINGDEEGNQDSQLSDIEDICEINPPTEIKIKEK